MATNGGFSKDEQTLALRALHTLRASIERAKTKEANDPDMVAIYAARIGKIDALVNKITSKEFVL